MFDRNSIRGIIPPIATPLTSAEDVDVAGMHRLVNFLLDAGVHGIFVMGGTGEFAFLRDRERRRAIEAAVDAVNGRVPVIAGVSDVGTKKVIEHAQAARQAGADFAIATPPYLGIRDQACFFEHFQAIARGIELPLLLYSVPQLMPGISSQTVLRLTEIENVAGIKDSGDIIHIQDVVFGTRGKNFRVMAGLEYHVVAALLVGAVGCTASTANINPRPYVDMYDKTLAGSVEEALVMQEDLNRFLEPLDTIPSWVSAVKTALHLMGICGPTVAAPAPAATAEETELVRAYLEHYGLLS